MKLHTIKRISGTDCRGKSFSEDVIFTMLPPKDDNHYGTGYYMSVDLGRPDYSPLIDVRYEGTTDVDKLADIWIENYYGKNAKEVAEVEE